jgi:hypothetical protein
MSGNGYLLPTDLGWECNDEINAKFKEILHQWDVGIKKGDTIFITDVLIAQIMDEMYAIIKKYQEAKNGYKSH